MVSNKRGVKYSWPFLWAAVVLALVGISTSGAASTTFLVAAGGIALAGFWTD